MSDFGELARSLNVIPLRQQTGSLVKVQDDEVDTCLLVFSQDFFIVIGIPLLNCISRPTSPSQDE